MEAEMSGICVKVFAYLPSCQENTWHMIWDRKITEAALVELLVSIYTLASMKLW